MKELWLDVILNGRMVQINSKGETRAKLSGVSHSKGHTKSKTTQSKKKKRFLVQQGASQRRTQSAS